MSVRVKISSVPATLKRDTPFSMSVTYDSAHAANLVISVDEGRQITPATIPIGAGTDASITRDFTISGGPAGTVVITCRLHAAADHVGPRPLS